MFTVKRIGEIIKQLSQLRYPETVPIDGWKMQIRSGESRPDPAVIDGQWTDVPASSFWGGDQEFRVFTGSATIPEQLRGKIVEFQLLTGREGQWDATNPQFSVFVDGVLRQGFDTNHTSVVLTEDAVPGTTYDLFLSAFTGTQNFHLQFDAKMRTLDPVTEKLYYDLLLPWQTMSLLDKDDSAYLELADILTRAIYQLDMRKPGSGAYYRSIEAAESILTEALYTNPRISEAVISCIGHTHIDVAWLWTLAVTEDKAVRSFSTVLELMRRYPEYRFMSSQPQLYQYVKKNAPEIYDEIKERIAQGRWEPEGGMFVEADCNLSSGESLVRQILYGKQFFKDEFGADNRILWLPDVFGYAAALPQILKKSGIRYFMTTKLSWNGYNKMPYDTFYWKGIDGSKILTHFVSTRDYIRPGTDTTNINTIFTTYNGDLNPMQMKGSWQRFQQKNLHNEILCTYGHGDGGGGPTKEMLEAQRRLAYGIPGCPRTKIASSLEYFENLEQKIAAKKTPIWSGELYLEYHRGTYTSMARNKKWNRRGEFALTNLETEAMLARQFGLADYPDLREYWEILMRNQFHDILPGSSIREVYEDSKREYEKLFAYTDAAQKHCMDRIAQQAGGTIVWNPNGQTMSGLVTLEENPGLYHVQALTDGTYLAWADNIPAKGYARLADSAPTLSPVRITTNEVETLFAVIHFNQQGHIDSWFDKTANRQILQDGKCGNVLMTYEDKPFQFDNWELQDYYREKSWPIEDLIHAEVIESGPLRYALKQQWQYQDSTIEEIFYFYPNTPRVDVRFTADWKEDQLLLKMLFPVELNATEATFEIQYGNVKRSTAVNTSWDQARFEVCHHKWMDVSEGGYGISFLNDCKYGVSVEENIVGLSLLKCGRYPNPQADREVHNAVYSIYPHEGSWQEAGTVREAYLLNNPMTAYTAPGECGSLPQRLSLVDHDHRNIMIESVKKAEDNNDTIIRLYEFENRRTDVHLRLPRKAAKIWLCDLMENREALLAENTDTFTAPAEPFGILTIRVEYPA